MFLGSNKEYPLPVAKYLRHVLSEDQRIIRAAHITQRGEIRLSPEKPWMPFEAKQTISTVPREFVWEATTKLAPLLKIKVRDSYVSGIASSELRILSIPISREHDSHELNTGALQRYLGECAWLPTSLLYSNGFHWAPIDDKTALATLNNSGTKVSLHFRFDKDNEITSVSTPGRYRKVGKKFILTPWIAHTKKYKETRGLLVPTEVEVEWLLPEGSFCWFRAEIVNVRYEFDEKERVNFAESNIFKTNAA